MCSVTKKVVVYLVRYIVCMKVESGQLCFVRV